MVTPPSSRESASRTALRPALAEGESVTAPRDAIRPAVSGRRRARAARRRPIGIVVLGMHRSGTSALTRILNIVGAALPADLLGESPDNATGHWEPSRVYDLHNEMFAEIGARWDDWRPINPDWLKSPARLRYVERMAGFLVEEFGESTLFVLKDPRICRLTALWKEAFLVAEMDLRAVLQVRNPLEVAGSLLRRDGIATGRGLLIWLRHMLDADWGSRELRRSWVSYSHLLDDWRGCVRRIGGELGLGWPSFNSEAEQTADLFLDESLRHQVVKPDALARRVEAPSWVRETYSAVSNFIDNGETPEGLRTLDRVSASFDDVCAAIEPAFADEAASLGKAVERRFTAVAAAALAERDAASRQLAEAQEQLAEEDRQRAALEVALAAADRDIERRRGVDAALAVAEARLGGLAQTQSELAEGQRRLGEAAARIEALEASLHDASRRAGIAEADRLHLHRRFVELLFERDASLARDRQSSQRVANLDSAAAAAPENRLGSILARRLAVPRRLRKELLRSRLFDLSWYRSAYPEIRLKRVDPVTDYLSSGACRRPHPLFDPAWYMAANPELAAARLDPFVHYLRFGRAQRLAPNFAFDPHWYLKTYPEVAAAGRDPLADYCGSGWRTGRQPHPLFDGSWYRERHPEGCGDGVDPLAHYLTRGMGEGWAPSARCEREAALIRASGLFDLAYYQETAPDAVAGNIDPGVHFLFRGAAAGLSPHPLFDTNWYLAANPEVAQRGLNPLVHYLEEGSLKGRRPNPEFDPLWYRNHYPQAVEGGCDPLFHYAVIGREAGLLSAPPVADAAAARRSRQPARPADGAAARPPAALAPLRLFKPRWSKRIAILRQLGAGSWTPQNVPAAIRRQCEEALAAKPLRMSVVMATWNRQAAVERAVQSVLCQSYPVHQLIVVDDGSEDETVRIIRERFADAIASRLLVLIERPHQGICHTRNAGLAAATGDLVAYLDSDNYWYEDFTLYMGAVFAATPHLATAYCGENIHDHDKNEDTQLMAEFDRAALLRRSCIDLNCFVHRRSIYRQEGGFDTEMTRLVDWELIIRYTRHFPAALVPIYLVEYFLDAKKLKNVTFTENWQVNWDFAVRKHLRDRLCYGIDPLRVGYVVWDWPALSQTFVMNELRWLIARGVDVRVYYKTGPDRAVALDFDIAAEQVDTPEQLAELVTRDRRNILHTPFAYPATTLLTWPAARAAKIPFTFMPAGVDITHHDNRTRNRIAEVVADPLCLGAVVAGSAHRRLLAGYGVPMAKMVMERQAVGLPQFAPRAPAPAGGPRRLRAVSIVRFIEKKGMSYLMEAALSFPDIDFVLYGYGPLEAELRAQAARIGAGNVSFPGTLDDIAALHAAYHDADLFVLPCIEAANGDTDGMPTVLLEAMAAGVPVVTTRLANIPDLIVDGAHGFLATPRDVASLAAALGRALALGAEERHRLLRRARERAVGFASEERMMRTLTDVWRGRPIDIVLVTYDTPDYDDWETTREIIDRIYEHTTLPFTLIVVDNGSQRTFRERIVERFGRRANFHFVELDENRFVGPGTNIAIDAGSSEYVVYLCSKEAFVLQNGWDLAIVAAMDANPKAAMGGYLISLPHYRNGSEYAAYPGFENWRAQDFAARYPERRFRHVQGGILVVRRAAYEAAGGFSELVVHDGTDIEYSYYLESRGYELLDIANLYSVTAKTWPRPDTLVDENALVVHALTRDGFARAKRLADRDIVHCNCCGWQGPEFPSSERGGRCPECGSTPFDRTALRHLSLSGVLQRRPKMICVTASDALRRAVSELCAGSATFDPADPAAIAAALDEATAAAATSGLVIDHDVAAAAALPDRLAAFVGAGGRLVLGEGSAPAGLLLGLAERGVALDEIRSASNYLGLDTRLVVAAGFPSSRELVPIAGERDQLCRIGRSPAQLLN